MPIVMKVKCFIIFFAIFIVIVKGDVDVDFVDCGSDMDIAKVWIRNCTETPCVFSREKDLIVDIVMSQVYKLDLTELTTEGYLRMFGFKWGLKVQPENPCSQWHCPVLEMINNLTYTAVVNLDYDVAQRPGNIELLTTYEVNSEQYQALCIEFEVSLQST